jgi:hypothetical protein
MQAGIAGVTLLRTPGSALLAWLPWREQIVEDYVTEWREC